MAFPAFFDLAPRITVRDPLAALLGAPDDGLLVYGYADAVRLAGHSCPTVAGAFLMARAALHALYPDGPAERGGVSVRMGGPEQEGTTGVVAQVLTLITGAASQNGFHGIGGRFVRQGLLRYATAGEAPGVRFQRRDTGQAVRVELDLSRGHGRAAACLRPVVAGPRAAPAPDHANNPAVIRVEAPA